MNRIAFICSALVFALASNVEAAVTAYFSAGSDCSGPPTIPYQPGGPTFKMTLCTASDFESICGTTVQFQAANGAESGLFRVVDRTLATTYNDPNSPFINWPVPITNPADTTDFGGTVNSGTPPAPGPAQHLATFTLEALAGPTNPNYTISLTPLSNAA